MTMTATPSGDLEPIETASADELRALQLDRLRWSLRHAYANVPQRPAEPLQLQRAQFAGRGPLDGLQLPARRREVPHPCLLGG